ncbi:hypothetical protein [Rhodocista pekingensis]|uniref:Lipoprotein n=1 Tax=Rhodocista pekingensis TaxID=201185 RepID=A0ABW2L1W6_9PROT
MPRIAGLLFLLTLAAAGPAAAACSCTGMTLKVGGTPTSFCVNSASTFSECATVSTTACGTGKKQIQCPLGLATGSDTNGSWMGFGFEIHAALSGTASQCTHGQGLQRTLTEQSGTTVTTLSNGKVGYTTPAKATYTISNGSVSYSGYVDNDRRKNYPQVGTQASSVDSYGADNYSAIGDPSGSETIQMSGNTVIWSDLPSIYFDNSDLTKTVSLKDQVFSFAYNSGQAGSGCSCTFQIQATKPPLTNWTELATRATGANALVKGVSCTVTP